jgi:hypothetical protein
MKIEDIIQLQYHPVLPVVLVLIVLVLLLYIFKRRIKQLWSNYKARSFLDRLASKQISGLKCPDGLGHHFIIDRVLLRPDGITLLVFIRFPGKIFCAEHIDQWTQMLGRRSYRFKNPLYDLDCKIKAVKACVPGVEVNGFLFFDAQAEFPKGHPERVIYKGNVPDMLERSKARIQPPVLAAWERLRNISV